MILLRAQRTLILTPGKCGSTSLHETFPHTIIGPQGPWRERGFDYPDSVGKHTMVVPFEFRDYRKLIVVRTAESHERSLWRHWNLHCEPMSFEQFRAARAAWRSESQLGTWFYWWTIADYLADAPRQRELVPLCELQRTVLATTGAVLPRLNTSPQPA